jgi:hypothetical protein
MIKLFGARFSEPSHPLAQSFESLSVCTNDDFVGMQENANPCALDMERGAHLWRLT